MCDYSLEHIQHRPAQADEKLITQSFESGSLGFAAIGNYSVAVCVQPDTRLMLHDISVLVQESCGVGPIEEVTFVHLDQELYHDGVKFGNGTTLSLQRLLPGVTAMVLPMSQGETRVEALLETA